MGGHYVIVGINCNNCSPLYFILFLVHTISLYQLHIFYSGLIFSIVIMLFSCEDNFGEGYCCSYHAKVKSTSRIELGWELDKMENLKKYKSICLLAV